MEFSSALMYLCKVKNATCRRTGWGESAKHVYLLNSAKRGDSLILVNEAGGEQMYILSLDDQLALDWTTFQNH